MPDTKLSTRRTWFQITLLTFGLFIAGLAGALALWLLPAGAFNHNQRSVDVSLDVEDTVLEVKGRTSPYAFVTILDNTKTIGTVTASSSGHFEKTFSSQTIGLHNIQVYAKTPDGQLTDSVTKNVNLLPQTKTTVFFFLPPTIELSNSQINVGEEIVFSGATIPNGTLNLRINNNLHFSTTAQTDGSWSIEVDTTGFSIGSHSAYALVQDEHGNYSSSTVRRLFEVQSVTPRQIIRDLVPEIPEYIQPPVIISPGNNQRFSDPNITFSGLGLAHSQLELWSGDQLLGSLFINHLGEWSLPFTLTEPKQQFQVRSCLMSTCSTFSSPVTLYWDRAVPPAVDALKLTLSDYRFFDIRRFQMIELGITIRGGEAPYELLIDWGDDKQEIISVDTETDLSYQHRYSQKGLYTGIVTITDASNQRQTRYFSVQVQHRSQITLTTLLVTGIVVSVVTFVFYEHILSFLRMIRSRASRLVQSLQKIVTKIK